MSAGYVSSQILKSVTKNGRTLSVNIVDKTTAWVRPPGMTAASVSQGFTEAIEENIEKFQPETATVAMKESEHQSPVDNRVHYTAYELDANGNVIRTTHLVRERK